jgi:hypothetical protein
MSEVFREVHASEVRVLFALGKVLDAFFDVVSDAADGDLARDLGSSATY